MLPVGLVGEVDESADVLDGEIGRFEVEEEEAALDVGERGERSKRDGKG